MSRARRSVSEKDVEQYKKFITKQKADASAAGSFSFKKAAEDKEAEAGDSATTSADEKSDKEEEENLYS
jgi:ribosomal protein L12E/L44/L45/RPP1/RPP2